MQDHMNQYMHTYVKIMWIYQISEFKIPVLSSDGKKKPPQTHEVSFYRNESYFCHSCVICVYTFTVCDMTQRLLWSLNLKIIEYKH